MSREQRTVKVTPIQGEPLRYTVESWSQKKEPHTVDLDSYDKHPECSCDHYKFKIKKNLDNDHPLWVKGLTMCRHMEAAYRYFAAKQIFYISEHINQGQTNEHK